jgi:N-acetylglucosaminyldiphosphoundecaprenol N-acetyl-beta-D-mannosaminyltransferase
VVRVIEQQRGFPGNGPPMVMVPKGAPNVTEPAQSAAPAPAIEPAQSAPPAPVTEPAPPAHSRIFEIPVDLGQPAELLQRITSWVGSPGPAKRVMYVNAHVLNQSREDPELRTALEASDLVYCDGYGVRLAAKALDVDIPHRMTGADWIWGLATLCEATGQSIYLLGSEPGAAHEASERLQRWYPKLRVAGSHHGYFEVGSPHDERVVEDINARRPDIVLVGMGTPKQERWVQANADRLDAGVAWTVGALFDYVSGRVPRAPGWLADNGLEWIFRLAIEPQRMWRRYLLGNPVFISRVMAQARSRHA